MSGIADKVSCAREVTNISRSHIPGVVFTYAHGSKRRPARAAHVDPTTTGCNGCWDHPSIYFLTTRYHAPCLDHVKVANRSCRGRSGRRHNISASVSRFHFPSGAGATEMPRPKKEAGAEPKKRSRNGCWPCKARKVKCGECVCHDGGGTEPMCLEAFRIRHVRDGC